MRISRSHWRRYMVEGLAVFAVLATLAFMAEVDMTKDFVIGTGLGAVLIASLFWFFDLRRRRKRHRMVLPAVHRKNGPLSGPSANDV